MLTRLMPTTAPTKSQGANQMRQQLTMGEHFRRGNADSNDNQDENAPELAGRSKGVARAMDGAPWRRTFPSG
jgi:hypothetical protein